MLKVEPTGAAPGATVHGGDLARPLGTREFAQILLGLGRYGVLRFPDQVMATRVFDPEFLRPVRELGVAMSA